MPSTSTCRPLGAFDIWRITPTVPTRRRSSTAGSSASVCCMTSRIRRSVGSARLMLATETGRLTARGWTVSGNTTDCRSGSTGISAGNEWCAWSAMSAPCSHGSSADEWCDLPRRRDHVTPATARAIRVVHGQPHVCPGRTLGLMWRRQTERGDGASAVPSRTHGLPTMDTLPGSLELQPGGDAADQSQSEPLFTPRVGEGSVSMIRPGFRGGGRGRSDVAGLIHPGHHAPRDQSLVVPVGLPVFGQPATVPPTGSRRSGTANSPARTRAGPRSSWEPASVISSQPR